MRSPAADAACPATSPSATSLGALAQPALAGGKRVEGAMLTPKGKEAEEGGCLPPARLELSKSLQMHLGLPGRAPVLPAAWPGGGVSPRSRRPPRGAVPPPLH